MIKHFVLTVILFFFFLTINAQDHIKPFEGKIFEIDNYIGDEYQNSGDLVFTNDMVKESRSNDLGFQQTSYKITPIDHELYGFSFTFISSKHGKISWFGTKKGKQITGDYLWAKEGGKTIHYTFQGTEK